MPYVIDIFDLQRKVFGLARSKVKWYKVGGGGIQPSGASPFPETNGPFEEVAEEQVLSVLGSPVVMPVTFLAGRYADGVKDGRPIFVDYPEYVMPYPTICEVALAKNIVKTKIAGRHGTVKEFVSNDDYQVRFKGLIVNDDLVNPPEQGIRDFNRLLNIPAPIEVQGDLFEWLGISELVVDVDAGGVFQIEGYQHVVGFTLNCISDNGVEVRLRDGL